MTVSLAATGITAATSAVAATAFAASAPTAATPVKTTPNMRPTHNPKKPFPGGAAFYIGDMDDDLDGFLRAEIMKEKLPIKLMLSPALADFIITGASREESKRPWHEG